MDESIRKSFGQELDELQDAVLNMGARAEEAIAGAVGALMENDPSLAARTIEADEEIDEMESGIESRCMALLALQQPMARDLRFIVSILHIISDIERLADHGTKISKKALKLGEMEPVKPFIDLPKMAAGVREMLSLSMQALRNRDAELARRVIDMDDTIDEFNHNIFVELVGFMTCDAKCITYISHLMVVIQSLERIGDHVTNICERVIYIATGELHKLN